jgi:hypothetical protein
MPPKRNPRTSPTSQRPRTTATTTHPTTPRSPTVTALYVLIAIEAADLVIAGAVIVHGLAAGSITWRRRRSAGGGG